MNEGLNRSNNRKAEIKHLREFLTKESITRWIKSSFGGNLRPEKIEEIGFSIDVMLQAINSRSFDFSVIDKTYEAHRPYMSGSELLTFKQLSERIVRDYLKIEELESYERYYQQETEFIKEQGYALNERYIISFPDNPSRQAEEWVISEFATGRNNSIRPVNGFKIKKDGNSYARAQYISMGRDENYTITKRN